MQHREIDKQKWDECIASSSNAMIYCNSWYLDIISPDWEAIVKDDYEAVMPVTVKSIFGLKLWQQPFYAQQLGIFSEKNISQDISNEFFNAIPTTIKYVDIQLNHANPLPPNNFIKINKNNFVLDISKYYEVIRKNYSNSHKRAINKANKSKVKFSDTIAPIQLMELLRSEIADKAKELKPKHYEMQVKLMQEVIKQEHGFIKGITFEDDLCVAIFFLKYKSRITSLFIAGNTLAKEKGWNTWLIDQVIQEFCNKNWIFDFEGSSIPSVAEFYRRFGAEPERYYRIKRNKLPFLLKWLK